MPATILSDNGVSSGSAGIKTTGSNDGQLALQTTTAGGTATTAVTIGTDQSVTFAQSANLPNTFGFKNRIINGGMVIDQRNAGASVTLSTTTQYLVDRFPAYKGTSAATVTAQRSTTAPAGFTNSIIFTASTGATPAAGDINGVWQTIEGFNVADLGWGTASAQSITLSFWVRSSVTGTYSLSLNNSAANRLYVATYSISAANTWEQKSVTIAGDTSGTWLTDNGLGIQVVWDLGYGSNFNGTAGAWGSSLIRRTSGSVQLIATTGATFYITGLQLERGSTATSFDFRSIGQELALCQRYYEKSFNQETAPANGASGTALLTETGSTRGYSSGNTGLDGFVVQYKVTKRATPTITAYGNSSGQWLTTGNANAGRTIVAEGDSSFSAYQTSTGSVVGMRGHWASSAEL
jgi:hypothetical protein